MTSRLPRAANAGLVLGGMDQQHQTFAEIHLSARCSIFHSVTIRLALHDRLADLSRRSRDIAQADPP